MNAKSRTMMVMSLAIGLAACGNAGSSTAVDGEDNQALNGTGAGPDNRPPQEAVLACADLGLGVDCTFAVTGKCFAGPDGGISACMPRPPQQPAEGQRLIEPPATAVEACAALVPGDDCTFEMAGICLGADDQPLVCTPPLPQANAPGGQAPEEAIAACVDLSLGTTCGFTVNGQCHAGPDTGLLACAMPPARPPEEALLACAELTQGDACSFTVDGHDVTGTCNGEGEMPLACGAEQPRVTPAPAEAIAVCDGGTEGDACSFDVKGACLEANDSTLACIPPAPFMP